MKNDFIKEFLVGMNKRAELFAEELHFEPYTDTVEVQFKKDMCERPIFAAYMAEHNIPSSIVFFNSIIEQALIKNTCFDNGEKAYLFDMLRNPSLTAHDVEVIVQLMGTEGRVLPEKEYTTIKASHITNFEFYVLKKFIENKQIRDEDAANFSVCLYESSAAIILSRSFLPERVCVYQEGNFYHSTCSIYGLAYGVRNYHSYVFFISDLNKYAVVSYDILPDME
ncbi:hypothetical protein [Paenibacillus sp. Leaf72]|uniref:hypothetical protein n=1 Tax=Paenibacillus sp. Leaf72 TaxID=1736234 RepID=UPI0006FD25C7|nr:hypothetical protein [Paenibacillus sp. Leaf72]KQN96811.1 hypothetical protein ASF12_22320 [Paenibacillus sp. Leaf72]